ncbi:class I SAM-dependent methyltransferase [Bacillus sp. NPDC094106]|uniref:class I SAM-dependent methyltransferase n=1 Tax=Bacillus sp. NPDC094106 TaxID=3363949 RepID=UPI00382FD42A
MVDHLSGDIVEIGSYKGKITIALALGSSLMSIKKRPIYAIDPFIASPPYKFFEDNVKNHRLEKFVIPIKKYSTEAYDNCPNSIAAIFIDGDHEYPGVKHDIIHYASRVVKGGLIVFHDYADY